LLGLHARGDVDQEGDDRGPARFAAMSSAIFVRRSLSSSSKNESGSRTRSSAGDNPSMAAPAALANTMRISG
jgi:hypothetical protein